MPTYIKTTNFLAKDSLPLNNAAKYVKGSEIDTEFDNIETADTDNMKKSALGTGVENALLVNVGSAGAFSTAVAASQSDQETGTSTTVFVSPGRQQFHSSAAKFWCRGTTISTTSITNSFNVTSLTDLGTGNTAFTLTTVFSATNMCIIAAGYDLLIYNAYWTGVDPQLLTRTTGNVVTDSAFNICGFGDQ